MPFLSVSQVMTPEVVTLRTDALVVEVAKVMSDKGVGSVVVVDEDTRPVGMVTERDLITRVIAKSRDPLSVTVGEIMSKPLIWVEPALDVVEAMKVMSTANIRHLAVMSKGELVGVVTDRDVLSNIPSIIELANEALRVYAGEPSKSGAATVSGYCDGCETWSDRLTDTDNGYLCEECLSQQ